MYTFKKQKVTNIYSTNHYISEIRHLPFKTLWVPGHSGIVDKEFADLTLKISFSFAI